MTNNKHHGNLHVLPLTIVSLLILTLVLLAFSTRGNHDDCATQRTERLTDTLAGFIQSIPGQVGVAVIINGRDTVTVNNKDIYPMMSVFKLHQAIALCSDPERQGLSLDSILVIRRDQLDTTTWSPMLKVYKDPVFRLSVRQLLRYSLTQSDNNASNFLFKHLVSTTRTDSLIAAIIPRQSFRIVYTEAQMKDRHERAYDNHTSPLGAAMLIDRLFSDSLMVPARQTFIKKTLAECVTGNDRLAVPVLKIPGATIAHKTGSGYITANGLLMAHNDVAYICLPNGTHYSIAVFVKDFDGSEQEAAKVIAHISSIVCDVLNGPYKE
jgi:beta-lactamase class A